MTNDTKTTPFTMRMREVMEALRDGWKIGSTRGRSWRRARLSRLGNTSQGVNAHTVRALDARGYLVLTRRMEQGTALYTLSAQGHKALRDFPRTHGRAMSERRARAQEWVPVQHGRIYCSPACGGGCTRKAFDAAKKDAAALAAALGAHWTPHVWENFGWHWQVQCGDHIAMGPCIGLDAYALTVNTDDGSFVVRGATARQAVAAALRKLRDLSEQTAKTITVLVHTHTDNAPPPPRNAR